MQTPKIPNRRLGFWPLGASLLLTLASAPAGSETGAAGTALPRPVVAAAAQALPVGRPWLREMLPANALLYGRLPSVWDLLGAPKGNLYDQALGSAAYAAVLTDLRADLGEVLLPELAPPERVLGEALFGPWNAPLEVAVLPAAAGGTSPEVFATLGLATTDPATVNALLERLTEPLPGWRLTAPLDADGRGRMQVRQWSLDLYFQAEEARLFLRFADAAQSSLAAWVEAQRPRPVPSLHAAEQRMDASGRGLLLWLDPAPAMDLAEALGWRGEVALLRAFGGADIRSLALGLGVSAGKSRFKALLDMPPVGLRGLVPVIETPLSFATAGIPTSVWMLGLPDLQDWQRLEGGLRLFLPPEDWFRYQLAKEQWRQNLGGSLEQWLGAFGDELLVVSDQAGQYLAVRVRDAGAYRRILARLTETRGWFQERREIQGKRYHHVRLPPSAPGPAENEMAADAGSLAPLVRRFQTRSSSLYWIEEGDYLIFAPLPQTLMDYRTLADKRPLASWLAEAQGLDGRNALLLATARQKDTPRLLYEWNLLTLALLGDLLQRPVDLFSLPTPQELRLPAEGGYGFALSSSPETLMVELSFESNPVELLLAFGGLQGLSAVGILAAIAIPAYLDQVDERTGP